MRRRQTVNFLPTDHSKVGKPGCEIPFRLVEKATPQFWNWQKNKNKKKVIFVRRQHYSSWD